MTDLGEITPIVDMHAEHEPVVFDFAGLDDAALGDFAGLMERFLTETSIHRGGPGIARDITVEELTEQMRQNPDYREIIESIFSL